MKKFFLLPALVLLFFVGEAQTDISGVINEYAPVTGVGSSCDCPATECATVTVTTASGFSVGDRVLLIQMKGAIADTTNTPAHGSIIDIADAGNYEFANIHDISGNNITFEYPLSETYFTNASPADSACVQLIKVPVYNGDVNVTGTLEAQPWNGITGGVLALEVEGTLTLQADISVDGQGFKPGRRPVANHSCTLDTNFYYQSSGWSYSCNGQGGNVECEYVYDDLPERTASLPCNGNGACTTNEMHVNDDRLGGYRGEGIVANIFTKTFSNGNVAVFDKGKGRWANGGGGGGTHNAGGGGGGNFGPGGFGGNAYNSNCDEGTFEIRRGYGGAVVTPSSSKVFLGGGGGQGHYNVKYTGGTTGGTTGTRGGGIIFIKASNVVNNGGYTISANGPDRDSVAHSDGAGGGGAGGSILLDISNGFSGNTTIEATGGNGGDHNNNTCHGTGGGGGGGLVWLSNPAQPANTTIHVSGGTNGIQVAPSFNCDPDTNWGATPGTSGAANFGGNSPFFNTSPCAPAGLLPVQLLSFSARPHNGIVQLQWTTGMERNNDYFTIERSADGRSFTKITTVPADHGQQAASYDAVDQHPLDGVNYYRLSQTDYDGKTDFLRTTKVSVDVPQTQWKISPNPATDHLNISISSPCEREASLEVYNILGNRVIQRKLLLLKNENKAQLNLSGLHPGWYAIRLSSDDGYLQLTNKFVKK